MPATVPIRPSSGNHSAACARFDSQRIGPFVEAAAAPVQARATPARAAIAKRVPPSVRISHVERFHVVKVEIAGGFRQGNGDQGGRQQRHQAEDERQHILDQYATHGRALRLNRGCGGLRRPWRSTCSCRRACRSPPALDPLVLHRLRRCRWFRPGRTRSGKQGTDDPQKGGRQERAGHGISSSLLGAREDVGQRLRPALAIHAGQRRVSLRHQRPVAEHLVGVVDADRRRFHHLVRTVSRSS